jgi:hypothetical protein
MQSVKHETQLPVFSCGGKQAEFRRGEKNIFKGSNVIIFNYEKIYFNKRKSQKM